MQLIVYGIALVVTNSVPIGGYRADYIAVTQGKVGPIPLLFIYLIIAAAIFWFVYNYTRHGKYMYAIGGNEVAAEVSGVNVKKTKIIIYITAAAMYAIAGFLLGGKSGGTSVNMGMGYELEAIAACTIGGVSVNGGIGKVSGVIIGVAVFELLKSALQFLGVIQTTSISHRVSLSLLLSHLIFVNTLQKNNGIEGAGSKLRSPHAPSNSPLGTQGSESSERGRE